jgi:hypothetical protein
MTYQVIFCGIDGVVMASDKRAGTYRPKDNNIVPGNDECKILISGEFAWAYSGGEIAKSFSHHFEPMLKRKQDLSDVELFQLIQDCRVPAFEDWKQAAESDSGSANSVILVRGSSKKIFRINPLPGMNTDTEPTQKGRCFAGQLYNTASFLFHRLHSPDMPLSALIPLAVYSVRAAGSFDSSAIDGLTIAVYRDSAGQFQFYDAPICREDTEGLDKLIRQAITKHFTV